MVNDPIWCINKGSAVARQDSSLAPLDFEVSKFLTLCLDGIILDKRIEN